MASEKTQNPANLIRKKRSASPGPAKVEETSKSKKKAPDSPRDSFREVVETVVFVIVLVLLLKTFVAEAFVIPTGSMATTLLGYHKDITCPKCQYQFTVNASQEVEDQGRGQQKVTGCTCPNCRFHIRLEFRGDMQP